MEWKMLKKKTSDNLGIMHALSIIAVCCLPVLFQSGCVTNPEELPDMENTWHADSGAFRADLTISGDWYNISYVKLLVGGDYDTFTVSRNESGSVDYTYDETDLQGYGYYGRPGWGGVITFRPDSGKSWQCKFHIHDNKSYVNRELLLYDIIDSSIIWHMALSRANLLDISVSSWSAERLDFNISLIVDARNDGIERSYAIHHDGSSFQVPTGYMIYNGDTIVTSRTTVHTRGLFEFCYQNGKWEADKISSNAAHTGNTIFAGKCRLDNLTRLYTQRDSMSLFEYTFIGSGWQQSIIHVPDISFSFLGHGSEPFAAKIRETGAESIILYGRSPVNGIYELHYDQNTWVIDVIDACLSDIPNRTLFPVGKNGLTGGIVQNGQPGKIYSLTDWHCVVEYTWNRDSGWSRSIFDTVGTIPENARTSYGGIWLINIDSAPILSVAADNAVWQYSLSEDNPVAEKAIELPGRYPVVTTGRGRPDDVVRVYGNAMHESGNNLIELTYSGHMISSIENVAMNQIHNIVVGAGRGDEVNRIYVTDEWYTWELTCQR
jgi:hypothetical protein